MVVVPVFDFIRLDRRISQFSIFDMNGSWEIWLTGKRVILFQDTFKFFRLLVRLRFQKEKRACLAGLIT